MLLDLYSLTRPSTPAAKEKYYPAGPYNLRLAPSSRYVLSSSVTLVREAVVRPHDSLMMVSSVSCVADMSEARRRDETVLLAL